MTAEWMIQVPKQVLNEISNNLRSVRDVTEFAECQAGEINTNSTYVNIRIRALEGIFNLITTKLKDLYKQILDLLDTKEPNTKKKALYKH